jgi:pSer/pThr/pTyr-binding forkhead associated (FHA) protein
MDHHFRKIEDWLEYWIEGSISRFLNSQLSSANLASNLTRAMERELQIDNNGIKHAPDQYILYLNPKIMEALKDNLPEVSQSFKKGLEEIAKQQDYILGDSLIIDFEADPRLKQWEIRSEASYQSEQLDETQRFELEALKNEPQLPQGAFLIVDGDRHYALTQPVINIGRRDENQLVIDNPRISRTHAQLRVRDGRYILLDVGSKAGTLVNSQRIKQHILRPGDVITIGGVELVYGEDIEPSADETIGLQANSDPPRRKNHPKER